MRTVPGPIAASPSGELGEGAAGYFIRAVEADAAADGSVETAELLERLLSYEAARPLPKARVAARPAARF